MMGGGVPWHLYSFDDVGFFYLRYFLLLRDLGSITGQYLTIFCSLLYPCPSLFGRESSHYNV